MNGGADDNESFAGPGNDFIIAGQGADAAFGDGGDDLMAQNAAIDRNAGAAGFDWAFHQYDTVGANDDMEINNNLVGVPIQVVVNRDRWQETEGDSGSKLDVKPGTHKVKLRQASIMRVLKRGGKFRIEMTPGTNKTHLGTATVRRTNVHHAPTGK
jgi:hypothetical protein